MAAVERELIRPEDGLALLFAPPFDKTPLDPGYIKGYPPGIRENGGQYTHAALWSVMAFAALGEGDKAAGLFSLLNPINHARTRADVHRYKVEPYVVAADVYAEPPHVGRGGWTWYTGSAGWMQRAGIESILGLRLQGDVPASRSVHSEGVAGLRDDAALPLGALRDRVENPDGVSRGVRSARARRGRDRRAAAATAARWTTAAFTAFSSGSAEPAPIERPGDRPEQPHLANPAAAL